MGENARPLQAEIILDKRRSGRRTVKLATQLELPSAQAGALVHDLSGQGLRLETALELDEGETLFVELPYVGAVEARIIWRDGNMCGCEFTTPISQAVVSAALLRSPIMEPRQGDETQIEEIAITVSPTLEQMTAWGVEFERTKGASGRQLLGFRQRSDGMIVAMVKKVD